MTTLHSEKAKALHEFLAWCHAEQYQGLDDEMTDDCEEWIANLSEDEIASLSVSTYKQGL